MADPTEAFVRAFFDRVLRREPVGFEVRQAVRALSEVSPDPAAMLQALCSLPQIQRWFEVPLRWPAGHFYSAVVDPRTVAEYVAAERRRTMAPIPGIALDLPAMRAIWLRNLDFVRTTSFGDGPTAGNRYRASDSPYPMGDAVILRMMIHHLRPKRIIEVGSGFSTACALDSIEQAGLTEVEVTCIEPNADRLRSLLRPGDLAKIALIEKPIQEVSADVVLQLQPGDLLLIDSTHVLKTGSDVHHELFNLLPLLPVGVFVHVHDIMLGFEYPDPWIFRDNHSWNEAYAWRAFLMYNTDFRIAFWNPAFAKAFAAEIRQEFPGLFPNPGATLWVERIARTTDTSALL